MYNRLKKHTMYTKKRILLGVGILGIIVSGAFIVHAASITTMNLIGNSNFKFHKIDMTDATGHQYITLPTTVGNNGQVRIGKRVGNTEGFIAFIDPAPGDTIDGVPGMQIVFHSRGDFIEIVADEAARTWWIVNHGTTGNF